MSTSITHPIVSTFNMPSSSCHCETENRGLLSRVDTICRLALGVFAAYIAPAQLLITMGLGFAVSAVLSMVGTLDSYSKGNSKPVCAQGYMDFLSGIKFPPLIGSIATASFIAAHMRHDPLFYVPFCGFFIGFWVGLRTGDAIKSLDSNRVRSLV